MPSSIFEDTNHVGFINAVRQSLDFVEKKLHIISLTTSSIWALIADNIVKGECVKILAEVAEFSSQVTDISIRIDEIETEIKAELRLKDAMVEKREDFKDQRHSLMAWLQSHEYADEVEDARLAGDLDHALLIKSNSRAAHRRCLLLTHEVSVYNKHYLDSYTDVAIELETLKDALDDLLKTGQKACPHQFSNPNL
ncbi:hypothetical protein diail_5237 [Diaporthe ilicicola]|nr:hypothetical protein diail_5237 [Diaporthe ilicicola]